uniref:Glycosyltransferase n=1 Tax=viral metagenome TaxID=1070528 RepID=A0A6C0DK35_9ZZZZ
MSKSYGFIITRHVNSEVTNQYWNQCIRCIRRFYPYRKIVVIDDNSDYKFVKADYDYKNVEIIQSEFKKRGELLGYYYFHKNRWFDNAVIIHDSVFFHKRITFEKFVSIQAIPFWHFEPDKENVENSLRIISELRYNELLRNKLLLNDILFNTSQKWHGCFGVQSFISHSFLVYIFNKYNLNSLINKVHSRPDRMCLERIFGLIFSLESPFTRKVKSLLGSIHSYKNNFSYTFEDYKRDLLVNKKLPEAVIKIWSGR